MTTSAQQQGRKENETRRQPSLAVRGERRRMERRLQEAGIVCQPEVSMQYQTLAKRSVLRGVESGGATKEIGRYFTFCDETGAPIAWLQPIDSVAVNGRHAVVIAPGLVSVEVFRVRNTYDVLIAKHAIVQTAEGQRGRVEARVLFRGREGHLPLDLAGEDKQMVGQIVPEFFNKAGEPIEIPAEFMTRSQSGGARGELRGLHASALPDGSESSSSGGGGGGGEGGNQWCRCASRGRTGT